MVSKIPVGMSTTNIYLHICKIYILLKTWILDDGRMEIRITEIAEKQGFIALLFASKIIT